MKSMVFFTYCLTACFLLLPRVLRAQIPQWEDPVQLQYPSGNSTQSAVSTLYGEHIAVEGAANGAKHYLVGNDGATIFQSPVLGQAGSVRKSAITAFGLHLNMVCRIEESGSGGVIHLWRSEDGGETWPVSPIEYDPVVHFPSDHTVASIDAYADVRGIHIVWHSDIGEVYYIRYDERFQDFRDPQQVTNLGTGRGIAPKVVTSASKGHVVFIRTDTNPTIASTRDVDFSTNPPTWEGNYESIPFIRHPIITPVGDIAYQSIVRRGDTLHVMSYEVVPADGRYMQASKRHINDGVWPVSTVLGTFSTVSGFDGRRSLTVLGDTIYGSFSQFNPSNEIRLMVYRPATGWLTSEIMEQGGGPYAYQTVSSSRTGVYFYWHSSGFASAWMKRKVYPISGSITEPAFFTGKNWISGDTYIQAGKTVWLKSTSETNILANKKLVVQNGATLFVEANATVNMGSGARIVVQNGGTVELITNATLTIPQAGYLEAQGGSQFIFGQNAGLVINGVLHADGNVSQPITFTGNTTWNGILLSGSGANGSTLQYANIDRVQTYGGAAVIVAGATGVSVLHSNISNNVNYSTSGLGFTNAGSPDVGYNIINGNGRYGIILYNTNGYLYGNTMQGNTTGGVSCYSSSPMFGKYGFPAYNGNNTIEGGQYGVYAHSYSYPYIGSYLNMYYGYNAIDANSIARVSANYYCTILAEQNWWGSSSPSPSWFQASQSTIGWQPFLTSNPIGGGQEEQLGNPPTSVSLRSAFEQRAVRNYPAARAILESLFANQPASTEALQAGTAMLHLFRDTTDNDLFTFMQAGWQEHRRSDPAFGLIIAKMLAMQGRNAQSIDRYADVIRLGRNTPHEKAAWLDLFYLYFESSQLDLASHILDTLQAKYGGGDEVMSASWLLAMRAAGNRLNGSLAKPGEETSLRTTTPTTYRLSESYPNPFNPSTKLSFDLPEPAIVSLVVYDVLGRKIAELAEGSYGAGTHTAVWNAEQQASGVYFARFTVTSSGGGMKYSKVNKLVLMK